MRTVSCLLVVTLLLAPAAIGSHAPHSHPVSSLGEAGSPLNVARTLVPHPSILIDGDEAFASPLSAVSHGTGTASDPYVMQDLLIVKDQPYGIHFKGTRSHVIVQHVSVAGTEAAIPSLAQGLPCVEVPGVACIPPSGIWLDDAQNVTIANVTLLFTDTLGIWASHGSSHDDFVDVSIGDVRDPTEGFRLLTQFLFAFWIDASSDITIQRAHVGLSYEPFQVDNSSSVRITDSVFNGPRSYGYLVNTDRVSFARDSFTSAGIVIDKKTSNLTVAHSTFTGGLVAIYQFFTIDSRLYDGLICGNTVKGMSSPAVDLVDDHNLTVSGNDIESNFRGLSIDLSDHVNVTGNLVANSSDQGASLQFYSGFVHANIFRGNAKGDEIVIPVNGVNPIDATLNWWGNSSGPSGDGPGTGDAILTFGDPVSFDPWLTKEPAFSLACPNEPGGP